MRTRFSFTAEDDFLAKALRYSQRETSVIYLNPNRYDYPYGAFKHVLAFGSIASCTCSVHAFSSIQGFIDHHKDWAFGYLTYELANEVEVLKSSKRRSTDKLGFPLAHFFIPKHLLFIKDDSFELHSVENPKELVQEIKNTSLAQKTARITYSSIQERITRAQYLERISRLKTHIGKGDIYEVNFCQEFYSEQFPIDPVEVYERLNSESPMPFSCFVKHDEKYVLCASPERFLRKKGGKLISQPIKGTAPRATSIEKDLEQRTNLANSPKERSENIMIVDLVRNDLSQVAQAGTVRVEELCKLYSFPQVHQLISTVTATIRPDVHPVEAVKRAFPMGSMTGAPKVRAMELIEQQEESPRGMFSGSVGYFSPEQEFDFNVVIRSILYNNSTKYLSYSAGSAITHYARPEEEYQECQLKTSAIRKVLANIASAT